MAHIFGYTTMAQTNTDTATVELLGGKGLGLINMSIQGLPVPTGFVITTDVCNTYRKKESLEAKNNYISQLVQTQVMPLYEQMSNELGYAPLVSVRSGARVSMPGMMDTILNVGLSDTTMPYWRKHLGVIPALDSQRRFIQMYGEIVLGISPSIFANKLDFAKDSQGVKTDQELSAKSLQSVIEAYLGVYHQLGEQLPQTISEQFEGAVKAVFDSWDNPRAKHYRKMNGYSDEWGTAVTIQMMVFGNMNDQSCSGVLFTRDPSNGNNAILGEFLVNAQGEDVVAGIRTPEPLEAMNQWNPEVHAELLTTAINMETTALDMQDMEFTIQSGKLYILQTRNGKRTPKAAFKIAYDMYQDKFITKTELKKRVTGNMYEGLAGTKLAPSAESITPDAIGLPAGGGVVKGAIAFSNDKAVELSKKGNVILVAKETTPDDIVGMEAAVGILTSTGGVTSHAAVVARGMDTVCVVGCQSINVKPEDGLYFTKDDSPIPTLVAEGDIITIDGSTGAIWHKNLDLIEGETSMEAEAIIDLLLNNKDVAYITTTPEEGKKYTWLEPTLNDEEMMQHLSAMVEHNTVIVDLDDVMNQLDEYDRQYYHLLDPTLMAMSVLKARLTRKIELLAEFPHKDKVILKVPKWGSGIVGSDSGYEVISEAGTVQDMMKGGAVTITEHFIKQVLGSKAVYTQLVKVMKDQGIEILKMPKPKVKEVAVYELLG
ncbi:MAG: pyruvate, phosphate dikinase [Helicobacteraceae bacterium]|nr:pyruvate, phosphate dikinase [Helicobacteraceae bacterium]